MCCIAKVGDYVYIAEEDVTINIDPIVSGKVINTALITISGFSKAGSAKLVEIKVIEKQTTVTSPDLQFILTDASYTLASQGSTFASVIPATNIQAVVDVATGDYKTIVSGTAVGIKTGINQDVVADSTGSLCLAIIAKGSQSYTSTTLTFKLVFHLNDC